MDLTEARLAGEKATLKVTVIFGGAKVRVPPGWTVRVETAPLAGEVANKRRQPAPVDATGGLVITGTVAFGGITVED